MRRAIQRLPLQVAIAFFAMTATAQAKTPALSPQRAAERVDTEWQTMQLGWSLAFGQMTPSDLSAPDWRVEACRQLTPRRVTCEWRFWVETDYGRISTEGTATVARLRSGYLRVRLDVTDAKRKSVDNRTARR